MKTRTVHTYTYTQKHTRNVLTTSRSCSRDVMLAMIRQENRSRSATELPTDFSAVLLLIVKQSVASLPVHVMRIRAGKEKGYGAQEDSSRQVKNAYTTNAREEDYAFCDCAFPATSFEFRWLHLTTSQRIFFLTLGKQSGFGSNNSLFN